MVKKVMKKIVTETIGEDGSKKTVVKEHAPKEMGEKISGVDGVKKPKPKKMTAKEREELLIENFVGLQHAMTNMSIKFGALSDNMTKLLQVFEEAAKAFVSGDKTDDKDMLKKIDSLLDQNKTIAKGLVLMEGKLRGRAEPGVAGSGLRVAGEQVGQRIEGAGGQVPPRSEPPRVRPRPLPSI
jgi:hypothetical protein